jgi:AraC-like DNA-binding protein
MTPALELLQLARLFDFLDDVVAWVKDGDGRYCWVNRAFVLNHEATRRLDTAPPDTATILGKTDYDLSPAFLADQFRLDDEQVLAGKQIINRIEMVERPDGMTTWHVTNKIPLLDRSGMIIGSAGLTRPLKAAALPAGPEAGFGLLLEHIRDHFSTTLTNQQMAAVVHMSTRAFERKFQQSFHVTPQQYLRKLRMRLASRTLVFTNLSLAEVSQQSGFSDQSHFTREFRRHFGRTPREYREHYGSSGPFDVSSTNSAALRQSKRSDRR